MKEKFRQFMIGRYGTDGLNQFLSMASIVLLLLSLLTRFSLFTWLGLALLILCYYRSLSRNISKRTEENYQYYTLKAVSYTQLDVYKRQVQDLAVVRVGPDGPHHTGGSQRDAGGIIEMCIRDSFCILR